jgi:hypothetical protein
VRRPASTRPLAPATLWRLLHGLSAAPLAAADLPSQLGDLREALDVDFAFAAELRTALPLVARAVTVCGAGGPLPAFDYELDGTPCMDVIAQGFHCVARGARSCFPRDALFAAEAIESYAGIVLPGEDGQWVGWLGVMSRRPLPDPRLARAALEVVSARAWRASSRPRLEGAAPPRTRPPSIASGSLCSTPTRVCGTGTSGGGASASLRAGGR